MTSNSLESSSPLPQFKDALRMSFEGLRRPVTLSLACAASLTLAYFAWRNHRITHAQPSTVSSLHRSNAVRRAQRRHPPREQEHSPIEDALQAILDSQQGTRDFGHYKPREPEEADLEAETSLDLTPTNLPILHAAIVSRHSDWDELERNDQYTSLQWTLLFNLVTEFWPIGTIVSIEDKTALVKALSDLGIEPDGVRGVIDGLNDNEDAAGNALQLEGTAPSRDRVAENGDDDDDENDQTLPLEDLDNAGGSQNMLNLLFNIAGEQAKHDGFIHRGIECNGCGAGPIQGIRYHCANCFDYDLCETCESRQVHIKTHVFYKVRIPAPSRGQIKQVVPKWYPGNPNISHHGLSKAVLERLVDETGMDRTEIGALFEQFKCLAGHEYNPDPCSLGMAIDRKGFDMYFIPGQSSKSTPANLIYDRVFGFYDTNDDNLIGFEEFIKGLAKLQDKSRMARLRRIFEGYDLDGDGHVSRKDFLRMFRAYYDLSRQLNREMIHAQEDFGYLDEEIREVVQGSQPISAAFGGSILLGHVSREGQDKRRAANGDLHISTGPNGVLQNDLDFRGDRYRAIGNAAIGNRPRSHPFRTFRSEPPQDDPLMQLPLQNSFELIGIQHADDATEEEINGPNPPIHAYGWPPLLAPEPDDIIAALGAEVPIDEITDPVERTRVIVAQSQRLDADSDRYQDWQREKAAYERWKRRQFYLDQEEGFNRPQGYTEPDSSDEESEDPKPETSAGSRRQSLRSRSSSKVRFDDSAIDTDYETRSNASSRSVPQNERWGGFELGQPEFDVGRDALYEAVQQGFNELLDSLFKKKEDEAMEALGSRRERIRWKTVLDEYEDSVRKAAETKDEALKQADELRTEALFNAAEGSEAQQSSENPPEVTVQDTEPHIEFGAALKAQFGDQIKTAIAAAVSDAREASLFSRPASRTRAEESKQLEEEHKRDPTLPQFRPDHSSDDNKPKVPQTPDPPPSKETLEKWLKHREYEEAAHARGGPGRLTFNEFRLRMVVEDDNDRIFGRKDDEQDANDPAYWEKSAELGKLGFVASWIEMASF